MGSVTQGSGGGGLEQNGRKGEGLKVVIFMSLPVGVFDIRC